MKSERGLVVERNGRKVTALTRSGDLTTFKASRDDVMVGMEVDVPVRVPLFAPRRLAPSIALSLVIVIISSFGYQQYLHAQPVVAYVTVDSFGSVELEVNQAGRVKVATAIDSAGEDAIASVQYRNRPVQEVVADLIEAQDPEKKSDIVVSFVPAVKDRPSEKDAEKAEKAVDKAVEKFEKKVLDKASESTGNVTSLRLGSDVREAARQLGISAGRAALWALSQQPNQEIDPEHDPVPDPEPDPEPDPALDPVADPAPTPDPEPQPSGEGKMPPGQEKKDRLIDTIKSALPEVDNETLSDLNSKKDSKEREKFLKDITKSFLNRVIEDLGDDDKKGSKSGPKDNTQGTTRQLPWRWR